MFDELADFRLFFSTSANVGHAGNSAAFLNLRVNWVIALLPEVWNNLETGPNGALEQQLIEHAFSVR